MLQGSRIVDCLESSNLMFEVLRQSTYLKCNGKVSETEPKAHHSCISAPLLSTPLIPNPWDFLLTDITPVRWIQSAISEAQTLCSGF